MIDFWALVKPTGPLEFWTFILSAATISLVVVAYRGLRSLRLAKTDMLTRAQRGLHPAFFGVVKEVWEGAAVHRLRYTLQHARLQDQ